LVIVKISAGFCEAQGEEVAEVSFENPEDHVLERENPFGRHPHFSLEFQYSIKNWWRCCKKSVDS
jgi:hypothetical protein